MCMFLIMNIISNVNLDHIVARLFTNWFAPIEGDVLPNLSFEMFQTSFRIIAPFGPQLPLNFERCYINSQTLTCTFFWIMSALKVV